MKFEFVKTCIFTPSIKVGDTNFNTEKVINAIKSASEKGIELLVLPELCLTGATAGDLFFQKTLLNGALDGLAKIVKASNGVNTLVLVGLPMVKDGVLYDVCAVVNNGKVCAFIPKSTSTYGEIAGDRYFSTYMGKTSSIEFMGSIVPFGKDIILKERNNAAFTVCVEIGSDIFSPLPPSSVHAVNGANIVAGLCCAPENVGSREYKQRIISARSSQSVCAYVYCESGSGESTTDNVFSGNNCVYELGKKLVETAPFYNQEGITEIDLTFINYERLKKFKCINDQNYTIIEFDAQSDGEILERKYKKTPFLPIEEGENKGARAERILQMQAQGLKSRIEHTHANKAVLGLSGGLDSTLAIIVAVKAIKQLGRSPKDVLAVTMPCFGTTSRTYQNTIKLAKALGVTLKKVDIGKAVVRHLKDIKHAQNVFDAAYENAQARERTQVLMDIANMENGLVVGTGDLSEMALGWATYNGDHMSMYAVNCTIPKTLVRYIVQSFANKSKGKLKAVLTDILDTPVSPELLPAENDDIAQKTEDIVGPYVLHDFFLYNMIRKGYSPEKTYFVAKKTFEKEFSKKTISKWLNTLIRRFFNQQFKRSCVPDGVKVGAVGLSPRSSFMMPSDAVSTLWLDQIKDI